MASPSSAGLIMSDAQERRDGIVQLVEILDAYFAMPVP
jgi:hypothetical protein